MSPINSVTKQLTFPPLESRQSSKVLCTGRKVLNYIGDTTIVLLIQSIGFSALALLFSRISKSKSLYCKFRAQNCSMRADNCFSFFEKLKYKKNYVDSTANSGRPISYNKFKASLEEMLKLTHTFRQEILEQDPSSRFSISSFKSHQRGICYGWTLDLAHRILIEKKTSRELKSSLRKGGRIQAVKVQEVYRRCGRSFKISPNALPEAVCSLIETAKKNPEFNLLPEFESIRLKNVQSAFKLISDVIHEQGDQPTEKRYNPKALKHKVNFAKLQQQLISGVEEVSKSHLTKTPENPDVISKAHNLMVTAIKVAIGIKEFRSGKMVSDLTMRKLIETAGAKLDVNIKEALVKTLGLELSTTTSVLGESCFFKNDKEYLNGIDQLEDGFYQVLFSTKSAGHAIAFTKDSSGGGWIYDPNGLQLKYENVKKAKLLLAKIIAGYECPDKFDVRAPGPYHDIRIIQLKKAAID